MSERQRYLAVLAALVLSTGAMGAKCGSDDSTPTGTTSSSSSSSSSSSGGVGVVQSTAFFAQAVPPTGVTAFLHQSTSFTSACSIPVSDVVPSSTTPPSGNANNDIVCILDAAEGDLYYQGMGVDFNAPPGVCNYVFTAPYWFWNYQPGVPGTVSYCLSTASGTAGEVVSGSVTAVNGTVSTAGEYTCNTDYTAVKGPNCCEGDYTLNISTSSDGTLGSCGNTQTTTVKYPGLWGNCAAGAGVDLAARKTADGIPEGFFDPTPTTGLNTLTTVEAPNTKNFLTNVYIANYYDPTLNGGNPPQSLQPVTLSGKSYAPQLYYELRCVDAADDILARIRVQVRSWDTVADFTAETNPYTANYESGFDGTHLWHDFDVWTDTAYFTYPQGIF